MVLVFQLHIFSRDSLVAFDSYQFEKVRNTRIVNLTVMLQANLPVTTHLYTENKLAEMTYNLRQSEQR